MLITIKFGRSPEESKTILITNDLDVAEAEIRSHLSHRTPYTRHWIREDGWHVTDIGSWSHFFFTKYE